MQAIVETLFDAAYLSTVVTLGIFMIRRSKGNVQYTLFGEEKTAFQDEKGD